MRHEPLLIILSRRTGNKERHRPKSMFRPLSARALADVFVTIVLKQDGTIEQMKMGRFRIRTISVSIGTCCSLRFRKSRTRAV